MRPRRVDSGRRPPAREASVPAPQGPRRRAAERLGLLVFKKQIIRARSIQFIRVTEIYYAILFYDCRHCTVGVDITRMIII